MNTFKRIVLLFISVLLVFSTCSCSMVKDLFKGNEKKEAELDEDEIEEICAVLDRACIAAAIDERDGVGFTSNEILQATIGEIEASIDNVKDVYKDHLEEVMNSGYYRKSSDFDDDGTKETIFVINNINASWSGSDDMFDDDFSFGDKAFTGYDMVVLYCDDYKDDTIVQSFAIMDTSANSDISVNWEDGVLSIAPEGSSAKSYSFSANKAEFVMEAESKPEDAVYNYAKYLNKLGYTDIKAQSADICDANGSEIIFVYSNGGIYHADVCSQYKGRFFKFYTVSDEDEVALYTIKNEGSDYLMNYTQLINASSSTYEMKYSFSVYRFDINFVYTEHESNSISRMEDDSATEAEASFFTRFNEYLAKSIVCNDPFEISGYRTTISNEDANVNNISHVRITNFSTSKTGTVNVPSNTFLFMRSGPSKSYSPILVNSYDDDSYIRLLRGTPVTILDTVNTGDRENPVWLKIRVKYGNQTFIGYSSQSYIDVFGVASVYSGSTIDIATTADSTELTWDSNDYSVATVDSYGIVTGHSKGLAMITVTSKTGHTDSCLVFVE